MFGKPLPSRTLARVFTLALLTLTLSAPLTVSARRQAQRQDQGAKSLTQPTNDTPIVELPARAKRYALIIGIDKYTSDANITTLKGAANDARSIAEALVKYADFDRDNVFLLTSDEAETTKQPTKTVIMRALKNLKGYVEQDGMLVVAFSGHGVERQSDHKVFLLPADASSNPEDYEESAIAVDRVKDLIKQTNAGQVMLLLDSCRNDPTAGKGSEDNKLTKNVADAFNMKGSGVRAFATLYAASEGQRAWEYQDKKQGYFSWAFVEGLKGAARDSNTGEVTLESLTTYVATEVEKRARMGGKSQRPWFVREGYGEKLVISRVAPAPKPVAATPAVVAPVAPTSGTFSVVSERGARIEIVPLSGDMTQARAGVINDEQGVYNSGPLPFGKYRITATREGSVTETTQEDIAANRPAAVVSLKLREATYTLTLRANVANGSVSIGAKGGPTLVYPLKDGQAVAPGLSRGEYAVAINPDDVAFQPVTESVSLGGNLERTFTLKRTLREQPLDAQFSLPGQWLLPSGWRATPALEINGEGRAMLNEEAGRFKDFELSANVELVGGKSVSFIVRAVDEQNYYLVRLSGARAERPNMLSLLMVKNGQKPHTLTDISLHGVKLTDQFIFAMKMSGGQFSFFIDDNSYNNIGKPVGLGSVGKHTDGTFAAGGVGVAAGPGDKAKIYQYLVCPGSCAKNSKD